MCPDILDPAAPPASPAPAPEGRRKIVCEFCQCELSSGGEYKRLSEEAKKMRDAGEKIEELEETISTLNTQISSLKAELAAARPAPASSGSGRKGLSL